METSWVVDTLGIVANPSPEVVCMLFELKLEFKPATVDITFGIGIRILLNVVMVDMRDIVDMYEYGIFAIWGISLENSERFVI